MLLKQAEVALTITCMASSVIQRPFINDRAPRFYISRSAIPARRQVYWVSVQAEANKKGNHSLASAIHLYIIMKNL